MIWTKHHTRDGLGVDKCGTYRLSLYVDGRGCSRELLRTCIQAMNGRNTGKRSVGQPLRQSNACNCQARDDIT